MYGISMEIDKKLFNFSSKHRHVTPQIYHLRELSPVLRVSTHIYWDFQGDRQENIYFSSKPRHVTPQNRPS